MIVNESTALLGSFLGGSGNGFISLEVDTFGDLPNPADYLGRLAIVVQTTGFLWRRRKGFYRSNGLEWTRLSNDTLVILSSEFNLVNDSDNTKITKFNNDLQTTGTTRIISTPDYDYNLNKPEVDLIDGITGIVASTYKEGRLYYDDDKKTWSMYNDRPNVKLQIGRELWTRSYNNTANDISDGKVISISGVESGLPTIKLAQPDSFDDSRIIGVATETILKDSFGEVTSFGLVNDINTSDASVGIVYLDADGKLTSVVPSGSQFTVIVGVILVSDAVNGIMFVNPSVSDTTVEVTETNGFPTLATSSLDFSISSPDRTFSIIPTGDSYYYYSHGILFEKLSTESIQIDNVEGIYVFYFDNDILKWIFNPTDDLYRNLIDTKVTISIIYWDFDNQTYSYFAEERHGINMGPETHSYLHFTRGCQYLKGLDIEDLIVDGDGSLDVHAQFSVNAGAITDEDLRTFSDAIAKESGLPIYYLSGVNGNMRRITKTGFSVVDDISTGVGITGRLVWNEFTGTTWQLTTVVNNDFVLCHVFAINGYTGQDKLIAVIGQSDYALIADARLGAETEILNILTKLNVYEIVPIATIIFQTGATYANAVKARVRPYNGSDYVDWRKTNKWP